MSDASIYNRHRKLREHVSRAQFEYNYALDQRLDGRNADADRRADLQREFDTAENRLFQFEKVLESFEKDNAEVLAEMEE